MKIWKKGNAKIKRKLEGWDVWKSGIKLENIRKIGKVKDDDRNKRENIVGGNKCKNPQGYTTTTTTTTTFRYKPSSRELTSHPARYNRLFEFLPFFCDAVLINPF